MATIPEIIHAECLFILLLNIHFGKLIGGRGKAEVSLRTPNTLAPDILVKSAVFSK
jgi:hypothetical protein